VPAGTSSVTFTLATPQSKGRFTINGGAVVTLPLSLGANAFSIVVTAENGTSTKTYSVSITRPAARPTLGISRTAVTFNQRFIHGENVVSEAPLTAQGAVFALTSANPNPQLGGSGVTTLSGSYNATAKSITSAEVTGFVPGSSYSFTAYATNSAGTRYGTVGVITVPNANANLSALTLSSGTLAPAFASNVLTYAASTAASFINVTPTAQATGSIVRVNGGVVGAGSPSRDLPLQAGINTVSIEVTAPDGSTRQTYTVAVSRAAQAPILATATTKTSVLATSATLGGSITEDNGGTLSERGIVFALTSANNNPQIGGAGVTKVIGAGADIGVFTVPVSGLSTSSAYSFRAFVTNNIGTAYSPVSTSHSSPSTK
jgi:hypothetical protein